MIHKAKVLTEKEVMKNRSNAYQFMDFTCGSKKEIERGDQMLWDFDGV